MVNCLKQIVASNMALLYLFVALIVQSSFIHANEEPTSTLAESREILTSPIDGNDAMLNNVYPQTNWMDMFMGSNSNIYPSSSAAMMAQATNSNKTVEEQLEDIKAMAQQITLAIQSEMANLLAYAMSTAEKGNKEKSVDDNTMRKRRSVETPMDSTQLVMRLLRHIKSNNDYQNIAIEKMMTAQEIAEKYNIPFNPDPEILSDLAVAANEHANELSTMLVNQANDMKNVSEAKIIFVPVEEESGPKKEQEDNYYVYAVSYPDDEVPIKQQAYPPHEYKPQQIPSYHHNHHNYPSYDYYYNSPYDTQIPAPPHHHHNAPVSQKLTFSDLFTPQNEYYSDPLISSVVTTDGTPLEEIEQTESELVGEEFEETVTSKVIVDRGDEPGSATVNHVMTYTVSEKSHFKTPQIERLPQQMQYCFLLI